MKGSVPALAAGSVRGHAASGGLDGRLHGRELGDDAPLRFDAAAVDDGEQLAQLRLGRARPQTGADVVDGVSEVVAAGEAFRRVLVESTGQHRAQLFGHVQPFARHVTAVADDLPDLVGVHVAVETIAGDGLVEHDRGGKLVAGAVDGVAAGLLGGHVRHLAHDETCLCVLGLQRTLGEAEVDELHLALKAHHHVCRRHVAMHHMQRLARRR